MSTKEQEGLIITRLSQVCLEKLAENRHKSNWTNIPIGTLFALLQREIVELKRAIVCNKSVIEIWREVADIVNFAAFIANNYELDKESTDEKNEHSHAYSVWARIIGWLRPTNNIKFPVPSWSNPSTEYVPIFKKMLIEKISLVARSTFSEDTLRSLDLAAFSDEITRQYVIQFVSYFAQHTLINDTIVIDVTEPKNFWQMFKRDILKFKKIKLKTIQQKSYKVKERLLFPKSNFGEAFLQHAQMYFETPVFGDRVIVMQDIEEIK